MGEVREHKEKGFRRYTWGDVVVTVDELKRGGYWVVIAHDMESNDRTLVGFFGGVRSATKAAKDHLNRMITDEIAEEEADDG